jgi:GT2 family glycosyltransferase
MIANRDIPLRIYSDKGKGLGYARQIVVMQAKAKYVIFVDGDVVLRRDFFRNQLEFMDRNPQVAVGLGRYLFKAGNLISTTWNLYQSTMNEFVGCAFIVRTDATRMVRGFDENIKGASEDIDLILRLQAEGWSTAVIESAGFYHNYRSSLKAFWREHQWFGYGDHYLLRKYVHRLPVWRNSPAAQLLQGLRMAAKAYRAKKCKVSFLIPVFLMIGNMAWWSGYLKAVWHGISHDA